MSGLVGIPRTVHPHGGLLHGRSRPTRSAAAPTEGLRLRLIHCQATGIFRHPTHWATTLRLSDWRDQAVRSILQKRDVSAAGRAKSASKVQAPLAADGISSDLLPELVVFDLDNTVWTPELYQLRKAPKAWKNIRLFDGAALALEELATSPAWEGSKFAAASRANKIDWAHNLLSEFRAGESDMSLRELFQEAEVYPGNKKKHFGKLRKATGISYDRMIFFDDYIGNCEDVAALGVMCIKVNNGLKHHVWELAVKTFAQRTSEGLHMGITLSEKDLQTQAQGATTHISQPFSPSEREMGTIKWYSSAKGYGFIRPAGGGPDVFLPRRSTGKLQEVDLQPQAAVTFQLVTDGQSSNRQSAAQVKLVGAVAQESGWSTGNWGSQTPSDSQATYPCFSMSQPYAALLVNGMKTVESRNNDMLAEYEGQEVALHVGRRDWPGDDYKSLLESKGLSSKEIAECCELPAGGRKGFVVAILTVGKTWKLSSAERTSEDMSHAVLARPEGIGKYVTEVKAARVLPEPVKIKGRPGVWDCSLPLACISSE